MTNENTQAADKRLNGTLRFSSGRGLTDGAMQTPDGVKRSLRNHDDLAAAKDLVRHAEVI